LASHPELVVFVLFTARNLNYLKAVVVPASKPEVSPSFNPN